MIHMSCDSIIVICLIHLFILENMTNFGIDFDESILSLKKTRHYHCTEATKHAGETHQRPSTFSKCHWS